MAKKKRYIEELTYFNAIACLLVVLVHVLSLGISTADKSSWQMAVIYFPWRLSAFVVPGFLFSGAVKMSQTFDDPLTPRQYGRYLLSRVRKILLPYLIWNCIYYAVFLRIGYVRGSVTEFLSYLLIGNLSSPFYYVIIVMQFYVLLPLWRWLVEAIPRHIGLPGATVLTLVSLNLGSLAQFFGFSFPYSDRFFLSYLLFWVLGLYVGQDYDRFCRSIRSKPGLISAAVLVFLSASLAYLQYSQGVYLFDLNPLKLFSDCLAIVLLLACCIRIKRGAPKIRKILSYIHGASFQVYLSHCLFLTLGAHYMQLYGIQKLSVLLLLRAIVTYTGAFGLYALLRFLRTQTPANKIPPS